MSPAPAIDEELSSTLMSYHFAFTLADPNGHDCPIMYASDAFHDLTGYDQESSIGKGFSLLHGPETSHRSIMEVRDALREERSCQVCMLNYKRDGSRFWNQLFMSPLRDEGGQLRHYVCIHADVTEQVLKKLKEERNCDDASPMDEGFDMDDMVEDIALEERREYEILQQSIAQMSHTKDDDKSHSESEPHLVPCSLRQALCNIQQSFVLSDPSLPDMPIVHASQKFLDMCGYSREQVVGRNCRFLQGPGTDRSEVAKLREAIYSSNPQPITVTLLNYRASGQAFWNSLHVAPVRNSEGQVVYYLGVQLDVSQAPEHDITLQGAIGMSCTLPPNGATPAAPPSSGSSLSQKMAHKSVTGAVRVAVRGLGGEGKGLRRCIEDQGLPHIHKDIKG